MQLRSAQPFVQNSSFTDMTFLVILYCVGIARHEQAGLRATDLNPRVHPEGRKNGRYSGSVAFSCRIVVFSLEIAFITSSMMRASLAYTCIPQTRSVGDSRTVIVRVCKRSRRCYCFASSVAEITSTQYTYMSFCFIGKGPSGPFPQCLL